MFITYNTDYIKIHRETEDHKGYKVSKVPVLTMSKDPEGGKDMAIVAEKIFRIRF